MSDSNASNGEQRIEMPVPGGRTVVVNCRWWFAGQVPSIGPPKPKSVLARVTLDDGLVVDVEIETRTAG